MSKYHATSGLALDTGKYLWGKFSCKIVSHIMYNEIVKLLGYLLFINLMLGIN